MTPIDYLIVLAVLASAVFGFARGFLREFIALLAWLIALWLGWRHSDWVAPYMGGALAQEPIRTWVARAIVVALVLLVGTIVGALASRFVRMSLFSGFDRLLGMVFGLLRGVTVVGVAVILAQQLRLDGERWWQGSRLLPYGESAASLIRSLVGDDVVSRLRR